jgi:hypothetical protein
MSLLATEILSLRFAKMPSGRKRLLLFGPGNSFGDNSSAAW